MSSLRINWFCLVFFDERIRFYSTLRDFHCLIIIRSVIERPKTPTMRSRIDEKNALIGLNNRLANILQRKQELEDENNLLSREV